MGCRSGQVSDSSYEREDFAEKLNVNLISKHLFSWDCESDCDYKCQQFVTGVRQADGLSVEKFYGKWPFIRVLGVTEPMSVVFSLGNLYVNYRNLRKVRKYWVSNRGDSNNSDVMALQYIFLLSISCVGWVLSIIFHIRDFPVTETLDYFGAGLIMVGNFNVIVVRWFELFRAQRAKYRVLFQLALAVVYVYHLVRLVGDWDYSYNMSFNMALGFSTVGFWALHSWSVGNKYRKNFRVYNNSIQLLPFENRMLMKLNYVNLSRSKVIPYVPIGLNSWLMAGIFFEVYDFPPLWRLVDAHSLWHLMTIFPVMVWYDWNLWDLELYKLGNRPLA